MLVIITSYLGMSSSRKWEVYPFKIPLMEKPSNEVINLKFNTLLLPFDPVI